MTTFAILQADLLSWSVRDDLATQAPSFIRIAEAEIGRVVKTLEMETDTTLTLTSPTYEVALPTGFLGLKHIYVSGAASPKATYVPPTLFQEMKATPSDRLNTTTEFIYTIESGKLKGRAADGSSSPVSLPITYYKRLDALSVSVATTTLLTDHYDIYLYASLVALWSFVGSLPDETKYQTKFDRAVAQLVALENSRRRGAGPLQMRTPSNVA